MNTPKDTNGRLLSSTALFGLFVGLTAGNFAYQLCAAQDWANATERSFFQLMALLAVWIAGFVYQPNNGDPI